MNVELTPDDVTNIVQILGAITAPMNLQTAEALIGLRTKLLNAQSADANEHAALADIEVQNEQLRAARDAADADAEIAQENFREPYIPRGMAAG